MADLNLDHNECRALHRVVRAMHDGECPKCHSVHPAEHMRINGVRSEPHEHANGVSVQTTFTEFWRCPSCSFQITAAEADAVFQLFGPFMEANLDVFEQWRESRKVKFPIEPWMIKRADELPGIPYVLDNRPEMPGLFVDPPKIAESMPDHQILIVEDEVCQFVDPKFLSGNVSLEDNYYRVGGRARRTYTQEQSDRMHQTLTWIARLHCKENPPCSSRADYACDSCMARAALADILDDSLVHTYLPPVLVHGPLPKLSGLDYVRSGDNICRHCGEAYSRHPLDFWELSYDNTPFLHVLCNGDRVKL